MIDDKPSPQPLWLAIVFRSLRPAIGKLNPITLFEKPVMLAAQSAAILATLLLIEDFGDKRTLSKIQLLITVWLWITVITAAFIEAIAEDISWTRALSLSATRPEVMAKRLISANGDEWEAVPGVRLRTGDIVLVEAGDIIPIDGEVIDGIASVDESAITGESSPVIRESGGDRASVIGGARLTSDWLKIRVFLHPANQRLGRGVFLANARRARTSSDIAMTGLLIGQTITFIIVIAALGAFAHYSGAVIPAIFFLSLLVTLLPMSAGALQPSIGIAGMGRIAAANILAKSGRAVEICGNVDTLVLDKTGTITFGNRIAEDLCPLPGISHAELAEAAWLACLGDDTEEGKSIVTLVEQRFGTRAAPGDISRIFSYSTDAPISGVDFTSSEAVRKGAEHAVRAWAEPAGDDQLTRIVADIARTGGTPLIIARNRRLLGAVHLKDTVKPDIRERFRQLRIMGVRTLMVTGDNPLTAASIAAEAGVDDVVANATPEIKLEIIRKYQAEGRIVAMCGDGADDAPALAQADVGLAVNDGAPAAKTAANLIALDGDPTKLIDAIRIARQSSIARGALITFSVTGTAAKIFILTPTLFTPIYPGLESLNLIGLASASSGVISAAIFNVMAILALTPLVLKGAGYHPARVETMLARNLLIYGVGGIAAPFLGIKLIDLIIVQLGIV